MGSRESIDDLRIKLAACEKERDEWKMEAGYWKGRHETVSARVKVLEEALRRVHDLCWGEPRHMEVSISSHAAADHAKAHSILDAVLAGKEEKPCTCAPEWHFAGHAPDCGKEASHE